MVGHQNSRFISLPFIEKEFPCIFYGDRFSQTNYSHWMVCAFVSFSFFFFKLYLGFVSYVFDHYGQLFSAITRSTNSKLVCKRGKTCTRNEIEMNIEIMRDESNAHHLIITVCKVIRNHF